jgi:hypothetical protein
LSIALQDALTAFLISLLFAGIRSYLVRVAVSIAVQLVLWWLVILLMRHHGAQWDIVRILPSLLGAIVAAHLRVVWVLIKRLIQNRRLTTTDVD